jgi:hypothetical protein
LGGQLTLIYPALYTVGEMSDNWGDLTTVAAEKGLTVATLRRWCAGPDGAAFARKRGRNWEVERAQLQAFLHGRRRAGSSRIRFQGFNFLGQQPNPRLKDATGWRFAIGDGSESPVIFSVWLGSELIKRLEYDGLAPLDLLLRGGEKLAEDKMLKPDDLWRADKTIELFPRDRLHLLAAAGRAPDFFLPSEAPDEPGVPILYELSASGFSSWVGDYLQDKQSNPKFGDAVVDWSYSNGRREVSTIRLPMPISGTKAEVVAAALGTYRDWCRRNHRLPGGWVKAVEARL